MKAIMISIKPQWVEKILNGEKTIEIRKTIPKCDLPVKVYIYCTKGKNTISYIERKGEKDWFGNIAKQTLIVTRPKYDYMNYFNETLGKVVAEFTLNTIDYLVDVGGGVHYTDKDYNFLDLDNLKTNSCLTDEQIYQYLGLRKNSKYYNDGYVWHIDNLKIYDKPKELSEFYGAKEYPYKDCGDIYNIGCWESYCKMFSRGECRFGHLRLDRPPKSWCYVEELENE